AQLSSSASSSSSCSLLPHLVLLAAPAAIVYYTLSLHDALPICGSRNRHTNRDRANQFPAWVGRGAHHPSPAPDQRFRKAIHYLLDRKSTRLNSSHVKISYAVFCLKKKKYEHHGTLYSCTGHKRR